MPPEDYASWATAPHRVLLQSGPSFAASKLAAIGDSVAFYRLAKERKAVKRWN